MLSAAEIKPGGGDKTTVIWGFPEIGVPPNPFLWDLPYKPSILGYPYFRKPPFGKVVGGRR